MTKRSTPNASSSYSGASADIHAEPLATRGRPAHFQPLFVLPVFCGGVLGTLARYGLSVTIPDPDGWPLSTLLVNLTGAFLLGLLLEALVRRGPDKGRFRLIRLSAGTGFMGAFTTYSTLALESVQLGMDQACLGTALYLTLSLFGGVVASAIGIKAAGSHHRWKANRQPETAGRNR